MTLYVGLINLDRSTGRLAAMKSRLAAAGLVADRIAAVDGACLTAAQRETYDHSAARRRYRRSMNLGEIGCYLSHLEALKRFLASGADHALVLEDDAAFGPEFGALLGRLTEALALRGDWDVVNLGNCTRRSKSRSVWIGADGGGHLLCHAHHFPSLTTALFWSRNGAASFLACSLPVIAPLDLRLKEWCIQTDRGLAFSIAPVKQTDGASDIDEPKTGRGERFPGYFFVKQKRHALNWLRSFQHRLRHLSGKWPENHNG